MQTDEEVGKIAMAVPLLVCKWCDVFDFLTQTLFIC